MTSQISTRLRRSRQHVSNPVPFTIRVINKRVPANAMNLRDCDAYTHHTSSSKSFLFAQIARENMSHGAGNSCICSNCFVRSYDTYNLENRSVLGKKRGSIKPFKQRTPEEVERTFWRFYLQKLKVDRRNTKFIYFRRPTEKVEELKIVRDIRASEVFVESPTNAAGRRKIIEVDTNNFWDFVYQQAWNGRIRVCEGELMYKITGTLKTLVSKKKIANFAVTRMFTAQGAEEPNDTIRKKEVTIHKQT